MVNEVELPFDVKGEYRGDFSRVPGCLYMCKEGEDGVVCGSV